MKPPYPLSKYAHSHDANLELMQDNKMALGDPPNSLLGLTDIPDMWKHVNQSAVEQDMLYQLAQANANANAARVQQAQYPPAFPAPLMPPNKPATGQTLSARAREMFLKRMGGLRAELTIAADDYLHCHIYGETVYLFYCFAGRDGCVKEDIDLFPSDQLITQFRMVLAT